MKNYKMLAAAFLLTSLHLTTAQATEVNETERVSDTETSTTITISSPRFARPLVERWIAEYEKSNNHTHLTLAKGNGTSDISLVLSDRSDAQQEKEPSVSQVFFGQYAILPVTTSGSEADQLLTKKEWNKKHLKRLFFQQDEIDALENGKQKEIPVNIYSGNGHASVSEIYAHHFGLTSADYRGKRIAGDDIFLNTAIGKDAKGVTINVLSNIFDLKSRHVKQGLSIVPLDVKQDYATALGNEADLDQTLTLLEDKHIDEVPVEKIGIEIHTNSTAIADFIGWVLANGTTYNHEYGLLNLAAKELVREKAHIESLTLTAQR